MSATADGLLRDLMASGQGVEETVDAVPTGRLRTSGEHRIVNRNGEEHPRRFAIGWYTSSRGAAAFARPRTNAAPFRMADRAARAVLFALVAGVGSATP